MSVVFQATIKVDQEKRTWYIELKDMVDNRVEKCLTFEIFEEKMQELGEDYGGNIDEVKWLKDEDVSPYMMDEVRMKMHEAKTKLED